MRDVASTGDDQTLVINDPRAIRALAHPARLIVVDALYDLNLELTATSAAALAGLSPSAMSYHLRALEKWGIIKRSGTPGDGRERPFVRAAKVLSLSPFRDDSESTASALATEVVLATAMEFDRADVLSAAKRVSEGRDTPFDRFASYGRKSLVGTPEEIKAFLTAFEALIAPLDATLNHDRAPGEGHVRFAFIVVPTNPSAFEERERNDGKKTE